MALVKSLFGSIKNNLLLSIIFLVGFLLRIIGTNPGYYAHGYEVMYGQAVLMLLNKTIGLEYNNLAYPPLIAWIMAVSFLFFFIPLYLISFIFTHISEISQGDINLITQFDKILRADILGTRYWQNAMYWGRYITALFGSLSIFLIYKTIKEFYQSRIAALFGALLLALNYRLVLNSHMGFHDMFNVFFIFLSLYATALLLNKPSQKNYIFSLIAAALTFLIKYQPSGFVAVGVAHFILSYKKSKNKLPNFIKNLFSKEVITASLLTILFLLITHADYIIRLDEVLDYAPSVVWSANEFGKYNLYFFPYSYIYFTGLGELLSFITLIGIATGLAVKKYRTPTTVILSVILISLYLFSFYSIAGYYTYNLLLPIAVSLIFAALFFGILVEWSLLRFQKKSLILSLIILFTFLTYVLKDHLINSVYSTYILSQPSYFIVTQQWLDQNIKEKIIFGTYSSNPAPQNQAINIINLPPLEEAFGAEEFSQEKLDYALIDFYKIHEKLIWWMLPPPHTPIQFWKRPDNLLAQNFLVLATRELLWNHNIKAFLPKWQVYGHSYAVTKISSPPDPNNYQLIQKFNFEDTNNWIPLSYLENDKAKLNWQKLGKNEEGSLSIAAGKDPANRRKLTLPGGIRWESSIINIKPGFRYFVTGFIKNDFSTEKKLRNGFLRMDFYDKSLNPSIASRPIISFVSSRVYGKPEWTQVKIEALAPEKSSFMKLGFQADDPVTTYYLDNVEVYESLEKHSMDKNINPTTITDDDLFNKNDSSFI